MTKKILSDNDILSFYGIKFFLFHFLIYSINDLQIRSVMVQYQSKNTSVIHISTAKKSNSTSFNRWWFNRIEYANFLRSIYIYLELIIFSNNYKIIETILVFSGNKTICFVLYSIKIDVKKKKNLYKIFMRWNDRCYSEWYIYYRYHYN